jgi:hypothetical protein
VKSVVLPATTTVILTSTKKTIFKVKRKLKKSKEERNSKNSIKHNNATNEDPRIIEFAISVNIYK